jgi:hypothetical protein
MDTYAGRHDHVEVAFPVGCATLWFIPEGRQLPALLRFLPSPAARLSSRTRAIIVHGYT